jgi:Domain of unknown function (DUF4375)
VNKNSILIKLSESKRTKFGKEDFGTQSVPQKVFSSIWAVESEVNNGGFSQYFRNSSSETAPFVGKHLIPSPPTHSGHLQACDQLRIPCRVAADTRSDILRRR